MNFKVGKLCDFCLFPCTRHWQRRTWYADSILVRNAHRHELEASFDSCSVVKWIRRYLKALRKVDKWWKGYRKLLVVFVLLTLSSCPSHYVQWAEQHFSGAIATGKSNPVVRHVLRFPGGSCYKISKGVAASMTTNWRCSSFESCNRKFGCWISNLLHAHELMSASSFRMNHDEFPLRVFDFLNMFGALPSQLQMSARLRKVHVQYLPLNYLMLNNNAMSEQQNVSKRGSDLH